MLRDRLRAGVDGALQVVGEDRRGVVGGEVLTVIAALTVLQCGECFRNDKCDTYIGCIISGSKSLIEHQLYAKKVYPSVRIVPWKSK